VNVDVFFASAIRAVYSAVSGVLEWVVIGIAGLLGAKARKEIKEKERIKQNAKENEERIERIERYLTGDEVSGEKGIIEDVREIKSEQREMRKAMEAQHREVDRKLNQLIDDD